MTTTVARCPRCHATSQPVTGYCPRCHTRHDSRPAALKARRSSTLLDRTHP
ncbi:hypothetical protein ACFQX7_28145 [Luedemannella flava]